MERNKTKLKSMRMNIFIKKHNVFYETHSLTKIKNNKITKKFVHQSLYSAMQSEAFVPPKPKAFFIATRLWPFANFQSLG